MIYLLKQGERYKVSETVEDVWEQYRRYENTDQMMNDFAFEFFEAYDDDALIDSIKEYVRTIYEDRSKLEFHLRQKNIS